MLRNLARARRTAQWAELKSILKRWLVSVLRPGNRSSSDGIGGNNKSNPRPPALFRMAAGYWLSQAIYVAAKLGLADLLKDGPKPSRQLAAATGTDEQSLFRLMRALSSTGIFVHYRNDCFALSGLGESLRSDVPGSLRAMVITLGEIHYQAWGSLLHSVRNGSPAFNTVFGTGLFEHLLRDAEAGDAFDKGMADVSSMLACAVIMAYDFSGISSIVDVGGGDGTFLQKILGVNPEIRGTIFDLEPAITKAKQRLDGETVGGRCSAVAGDFFDSIPEGADAYFLCGVIHDWSDECAVTILRNCRKAMAQNGRVLLVEMVVPDGDASCFSKLLDVNMLVMTEGRERTRAEFSALLDAAGYKITKIVPTLAPQSVIEAVPGTSELTICH